jgi:hypothetical protein
MTTPETIQIWLSEQATPLLIISVALVLGFAILFISARGRRSKMVSRRSGLTEDTFVEDLTPFGYDPQVARTTYRYLQERQNIYFPILALDALDEDLGLDSEDVNQTIHELLDLTGREYLPGLLHSPLVNVEDLVRYIQASPRKSQKSAVA